MRERKYRYCIGILGILLICTLFEIPVKTKEKETGDCINSYNKVSQIGEAKDRTFKVELTVPGEAEKKEENIFIALDLQSGLGRNYDVWPYYMRGIYNMCSALTEQHRGYIFHFYFIAYNAAEVPVLSEKVTASKEDRKETLGDVDKLYLDEEGNPVPDGSQMFRYYQDPREKQPGTLLAYLQQLSQMSLPGNCVPSDSSGMQFKEEQLFLINSDAEANLTYGINMMAALSEIERLFVAEKMSEAKIVLMSDTFPTEDHASGPVIPGDENQQKEVGERFCEKYSEMLKLYSMESYLLAYETIAAHHYPDLWKEFLNNFKEENQVCFTERAGQITETEDRKRLNQSLLKIGEKTGVGFKSAEVSVSDKVSKQFYVVEGENEYRPEVNGKYSGIVTEISGGDWEEKEITFHFLSEPDEAEMYYVTYYVRANKDYIGGEDLEVSHTVRGEKVYIPWRFETQNGCAHIFYGDKATLVNTLEYSDKPYEIPGSNETENPEVPYFVGTDYKDKDGNGIVLDFFLESYMCDGTYSEVLKKENLKLADWKGKIETAPDATTEYAMKFVRKTQASYGKGGMWNPVNADGNAEEEKAEVFLEFTEVRVFVEINVTYGTIHISKELIGNSSDGDIYTGFPIEIRGEKVFLQSVIRPEETVTIGRLKRGVYYIKERVPQTFTFSHGENVTSQTVEKQNTLAAHVGFEDGEQKIFESHEIKLYADSSPLTGNTSILELENHFLTEEE